MATFRAAAEEEVENDTMRGGNQIARERQEEEAKINQAGVWM